MLKEIENPMVIDSLWRHREERKVIGECGGCLEDIYEGEDIYDFNGDLVHQESACCQDYVANKSFCKVAGE